MDYKDVADLMCGNLKLLNDAGEQIEIGNLKI